MATRIIGSPAVVRDEPCAARHGMKEIPIRNERESVSSTCPLLTLHKHPLDPSNLWLVTVISSLVVIAFQSSIKSFGPERSRFCGDVLQKIPVD